MTQLTEHFTLEEMIASDTADACDIDNTPPPEVVDELRKTAELLEKVRSALGDVPVTVTSGYRCEDLNDEVGGVANSQHMTGQAADFIAPDFGTPDEIYDALQNANPPIPYDQLIREYGDWVHISQSDDPRDEEVYYA
jgi:hypothetical protein